MPARKSAICISCSEGIFSNSQQQSARLIRVRVSIQGPQSLIKQASPFKCSTCIIEAAANQISSSIMATVAETRTEYPVTPWKITAALIVVLGFVLGLSGVYFTMPASDYSFLRLPKSVEDLEILRDHLESYTRDYTIQVLVGYLTVYIFMQTFMIPGTVFMSLLAGALFGVFKGVALVLVAATAGASSCYFLSKLIGRPLVFSLWPDKLRFFQAQVAKRRGKLLNYMLFLRVTPTLPNTFINVASPIVDVPYHIFFVGTFIGLIPAAYVTVRAGLALGELRSIGDLYDFQSIATLFLIGIVSVTPILMSKKGKEE